jgi:hypothetical protein
LPAILVPTVVLGTFMAYAVIQPFRAARFKELDFDSTSLSSIVDTFVASRDSAYAQAEPDGPVAATTASFCFTCSSRFCTTLGSSICRRFRPTRPKLPSDPPSRSSIGSVRRWVKGPPR